MTRNEAIREALSHIAQLERRKSLLLREKAQTGQDMGEPVPPALHASLRRETAIDAITTAEVYGAVETEEDRLAMMADLDLTLDEWSTP